MEAFVYYRHETEAKEMKETTAVLAKFCREMDGIVKKTIDERNPNQTVSRILNDVKAFMKASIVSHTSRGKQPSPAQATDVSGPPPQPMNLTRKQATPKTMVCPLTCTPRKAASQTTGNSTPPKKAPQGPLPPKDTNNVQPATAKSYAETVGTPNLSRFNGRNIQRLVRFER